LWRSGGVAELATSFRHVHSTIKFLANQLTAQRDARGA
jgi:hypothetical protein